MTSAVGAFAHWSGMVGKMEETQAPTVSDDNEVKDWIGIAARYEERLTAALAEIERLRAALSLDRDDLGFARKALRAAIDGGLMPGEPKCFGISDAAFEQKTMS